MKFKVSLVANKAQFTWNLAQKYRNKTKTRKKDRYRDRNTQLEENDYMNKSYGIL